MSTVERRTIGIEEELILVREDGTIACEGADDEFYEVDCEQGSWKPEIFRCMIETNTQVRDNVPAVVDDVFALRRQLAERMEAYGLRIMAMGLHPQGPPGNEQQAMMPQRKFCGSDWAHPPLSAGAMTTAMQVHVGVPEEHGWRVAQGVRPWLPVLAALSASSPWREGHLTGFRSNRLVVRKQMPSGEVPPKYETKEQWQHAIDTLQAMAREHETANRFEVRASSRYPTVEIRIFDQMARRENIATIGAVAMALVDWITKCVRNGEDPEHGLETRTEILNIWRYLAARDGSRAVLKSSPQDPGTRLTQMLDRMLDVIRDSVQALGLEHEVGRAPGLLAEEGESTVRATGTPDEVVQRSCAETLSGRNEG